MKTKMKVAVCTLLCMTMACAAANAEGGTTNSMNSGRPQTQQSQMKNRKKKGMQQGQMPGMDEQGQAPDMNGQNNGQKPNDGAQENRQQNGNNKQNSNNGMQQKPDDQNVPKDMPSRVDTRKLLEDGVIDEDTYNANISKRTRRRSRKANRMIPSSRRKSWRTKRMTTAPISPNCLKSAAVWMKRSSRACSMRV